MGILYEFLLLLVVVCFVAFLVWKLFLSKNPLIRSWLRQELVDEKAQIVDNLSDAANVASKINLKEVEEDKEQTDNIIKKIN